MKKYLFITFLSSVILLSAGCSVPRNKDSKPKASPEAVSESTQKQEQDLAADSSGPLTVSDSYKCGDVNAAEPNLTLRINAPPNVLLCYPIPVNIIVINSGSGYAEKVKVTINLPEGLTDADGGSSIILDAGTLKCGQSKEFTLSLKASKKGKYVYSAEAASANGLKSEATAVTTMRQPVFSINMNGPEKDFLYSGAIYSIAVGNQGDAEAKDNVIEYKLPSGVKFVSADNNGRYSAGKVVWKIANLGIYDSRAVRVKVVPEHSGTIESIATVSASCTETASSSAHTVVADTPAVLLEIHPSSDKVQIGADAVYEISVTNLDSANATNITIVCTLDDNLDYVSSTGPTEGRMQSDITLVFASLSELAPKAEATWRVVVKAVKAGDVRFQTTMYSDQIDRLIEKTEKTNIYE